MEDTTIRLKLGHSPDSDDAFMFHGLAAGLVETGGLEFEHILKDIQTLNEWAREGRIECTAISVHAYAYVADKYAILSHGASMGDGYGPMVVSPGALDLTQPCTIAVPGEMTSAFLAFSLYLGHRPVRIEDAQPADTVRYAVVPFDEIIEAVLAGRYDAGLIIHEGQLTHGDQGLTCHVDLGAWWKERTGLPLPLGVNAIRRDLPPDVQTTASRALKASIEYGLAHRADALDYAMGFARDMKRTTADTFVGMYVNDWTVDMGEAGKRSMRQFLGEAVEKGLAPGVGEIDFVD